MISFAHRTVFVHVPKCGGQSVELAFLDDLGLPWKRRGALLMGRKPRQWGGAHPRLAHLKASEYLRFGYITPTLWSAFFSFAVVRNPFARVVSAYHYLGDDPGSLEAFCRSLAGNRRKGFMDPAWEYVSDRDGEQLVSAWYRLEEIGANWPDIAARAQLRTDRLPHRNAGTGRKPDAVWTEAALQAVRDTYAEDFRRFGYAAESPPAMALRAEPTG